MQTYYFTFGQCHVHPSTEEPLRDYWIEIEAKSPEAARELMVSMFGVKWSHQYHEKEFMKSRSLYSHGCYSRHEVD